MSFHYKYVRILVLDNILKDPYKCNKTKVERDILIDNFETLDELVLAGTNPTQSHCLPVV